MLAIGCGPSGGGSGGACKDNLLAGDVVITEVFADFKGAPGGSGADTGKEWFEIFNASDRPIELQGLTVTHSRPDGSKGSSHTMTQVTVAPGQYLVLGNSASDLLPAYVDYGYSDGLGDFFNTDGGKLTLSCGDSEIDSAEYAEIKEGHSRELSATQPPDYTFNDNLVNWCQGNNTEFDPGNFGTPGQDSDCTPIIVGACSDGGTMRDAVLPGAGDLVITEIMPNPGKASDTTAEWFEAKVIKDVDLNGVSLDRAGDTAKPDVITSPDCIHVTAGSFVVFAKSTDMVMNGGLPAAAIKGTFKFSMVAGTVAAPGDVQILAGATVVDAVRYTKSANGASLQLDPDFSDALANDAESNFCNGTAAYGLGDLGTPGAVNGQCTLLPPAGMCSDNNVNRAIAKPAAGQLVITEVLANPANVMDGTTDADKEWFEITNTGAAAFDLNELILKSPGTAGAPVASASCISVAAGGFALIARSADPAKNGMLPPPDTTFSFSLVDSGANAGVSVLDGATVLDAVAWTSVGSGLTTALDPDHLNTTDNDTFNVTAGSICRGATGYGDMTNKGTPRAANEQCP